MKENRKSWLIDTKIILDLYLYKEEEWKARTESFSSPESLLSLAKKMFGRNSMKISLDFVLDKNCDSKTKCELERKNRILPGEYFQYRCKITGMEENERRKRFCSSNVLPIDVLFVPIEPLKEVPDLYRYDWKKLVPIKDGKIIPEAKLHNLCFNPVSKDDISNSYLWVRGLTLIHLVYSRKVLHPIEFPDNFYLWKPEARIFSDGETKVWLTPQWYDGLPKKIKINNESPKRFEEAGIWLPSRYWDKRERGKVRLSQVPFLKNSSREIQLHGVYSFIEKKLRVEAEIRYELPEPLFYEEEAEKYKPIEWTKKDEAEYRYAVMRILHNIRKNKDLISLASCVFCGKKVEFVGITLEDIKFKFYEAEPGVTIGHPGWPALWKKLLSLKGHLLCADCCARYSSNFKECIKIIKKQ